MATEAACQPPTKKPKVDEDDADMIDICEQSSDGDSGYDSAGDYDSPERREKYHRYLQRVTESDGFDVDHPGFEILGGILPLDMDMEDCPDMPPWNAVWPCAEFSTTQNDRRSSLVHFAFLN